MSTTRHQGPERITDAQVEELGISPAAAVAWAEEALRRKADADLPPKTRQHLPGGVFFHTMPCVLPGEGLYAVKAISRHPGAASSLRSAIMLMDSDTGDLLSVLDGNAITAMRTGAVAALAGRELVAGFASASFGFVGLGAMARSAVRCLASQFDRPHDVWLLRYKDQAERFAEELGGLANVRFRIAGSREELVGRTSALYSCVTSMDGQFLPPEAYPPGYTVVPVHSRGFQDCDTVFDRVVADDLASIAHFDNFGGFRNPVELTDVLLGKARGRESDGERILAYNFGIALCDLWFAARIREMAGMRR